jgi:hypothetical protein
MNRMEIRLVAIQPLEGGTTKETVVERFDVKGPKPSASGKLNYHASGKVELNGDRWQFGTNITRIGATT